MTLFNRLMEKQKASIDGMVVTTTISLSEDDFKDLSSLKFPPSATALKHTR